MSALRDSAQPRAVLDSRVVHAGMIWDVVRDVVDLEIGRAHV